jgi:hypothetical protein
MVDFYLLQKRYLSLSSKSEAEIMRLPKKKIVRLLDELCSIIVRLRDRQCVICGSQNGMTNGHFIHRNDYSLRWNLTNCNCQCSRCNGIHEIDTDPYERWMMETYGSDIIDILQDMRIAHQRFDKYDLYNIYQGLVEAGNESIQD